MKRLKLLLIPGLVLVIAAVTVVYLMKPISPTTPGIKDIKSKASEGSEENPYARLEYDFMRFRDPVTNTIPKNIRIQELNFIKKSMAASKAHPLIDDKDWRARGPYNVGGRTKALAIDIKNENIILAGCVSSGMWKSIDSGNSWVKTTAPDQLHSVSCITQNKASGRENIWYYGTGEFGGYGGGTGGSAGGPAGTTGFYRGDGVFKSVDNGSTWSLLSSTVSGTAEITDSFDFVYKIITFGDNGIFAATSTGVFISSDGGDSWKHVLDFGEKYASSDIAITSQGIFYAAVDGDGSDNGLYKSLDGEEWEDISPPDFPDSTMRSIIAIPPSNEKIIYFLTDVAQWKQTFKKYEEGVGWTDLTPYMPHNAEMTTYGGAMLILYVKPDDENTLFLGTVGLYRSKDGGHTYDVIGSFTDFHVDQHAIAFFQSDPKAMIVGNDGGLFRTSDNTARSSYSWETGLGGIEWRSLNNGYVTAQFYTVAIDHGTQNSELVLGGTQDNAWSFTSSTNPLTPWTLILPGSADGGAVAVSDGGQYFYTGQGGWERFMRHEFLNGVPQSTDITPASLGGMGLWMAPFILDPHDTKIVYLANRHYLWRNSDVTAIPLGTTPTDVNWTKFQNVETDWHISALGMSQAEPRRLYFGCVAGSMFRLDNPHQGQPTPVALAGNNIQYYGHRYVHCIAVDPRNVNKLLAGFPNYHTMSIYMSEDSGDNWTPVAGNLEEKLDGTGSGPSVRWISTLYVEDKPVYLAGTSVGLFSTMKLDGMNTVWTLEGATTIGNVVVDMIDVRQSDGFVAVATHGNGIYSAHITKLPSGVRENPSQLKGFALFPAYPNPFNAMTTIRFVLPHTGPVKLTVHNILGEQVATLIDGSLQQGEHQVQWAAGPAASGTYFIKLSFENFSKTQKVILQK